MAGREVPRRTERAYELYGNHWFNGEPVPVAEGDARVLALVFWDHTCVRSARILALAGRWTRDYADHGLAIVAVHTPKFPFGRDPDVVERAIRRAGLALPVVMDNEALIWSRYGIRSWPAIALVDDEGFTRFIAEGDIDPDDVERHIQALMIESGVGVDFPLAGKRAATPEAMRSTGDMFTGYLRGSIGNVEGYSPESTVRYTDPELYFEGRFYVEGMWVNDRNSLRLADGVGDVIAMYRAVDVYAILTCGPAAPVLFEVQQDGSPLVGIMRGEDVGVDAEGRTVVRVDEPRAYHIVHNLEFGSHTLKLRAREPGAAIYSLTFLGGVLPDSPSRN